MKRLIYLSLSIILSLSVVGCATAMFGGKSGTRFNASVQEVYDASLALLQEQNMPVVKRSITKDRAQIASEYPNGTSLHILIKSMSPQYCETNIRVGSVGDDYRAYDLMKQIESRLNK